MHATILKENDYNAILAYVITSFIGQNKNYFGQVKTINCLPYGMVS